MKALAATAIRGSGVLCCARVGGNNRKHQAERGGSRQRKVAPWMTKWLGGGNRIVVPRRTSLLCDCEINGLFSIKEGCGDRFQCWFSVVNDGF